MLYSHLRFAFAEAPMALQSVDTNPRKLPRQARSKATVDAVITAAAQVLIERGYEGTTTAHVAERAGVSVGSLYQYFPNKEALIAVLIERHADEIVRIMQRTLSDPANATLEDGLRAIIRAATSAHHLDPTLHKILNEQVPRVGRLAKAMDSSRQITRLIERFLRAHASEMKPGLDPAVAAVVVETALEALSHKAVIARRDLLADGLIGREMFSLVSGYVLRPDRKRRRRRPSSARPPAAPAGTARSGGRDRRRHLP
jgi:AcrR family transcriptional regulator